MILVLYPEQPPQRFPHDLRFRPPLPVGSLAFDLLVVQERLLALDRALPVPTNQEAMREDEVPPDLATEVSGCIECVAEDHLREAIAILERGSNVTARELERDWRECQKRRRRYEGR